MPLQPTSLPGRWRRPWVGTVLVAALFLLLSIAATWPMPLDPAQRSMAPMVGNFDYTFNMWVIFWGAHALLTDPLNLHHANIFTPEPYTFAYSDIELTHSLLALPVILVFYNPVLAFNFLLVVALTLGAIGAYLLGLRLTGHRGAAVLTGAIFAFNPAHFARWGQIQFIGDHWLPWFAWALIRWLDREKAAAEGPARSRRWAVVAAIFYCLHALTGSHNAVFGALLGGALVLWRLAADGTWRRSGTWSRLATMAVIVLAVLGPLFYPYIVVEEKMLEERYPDVWALDHRSAKPHELLAAESHFYRWLNETAGWPSAFFERRPLRTLLFPGFVPLALAALGFALRRERGANGRSRSDEGRLEGGTTRRARSALAWSLDAVAVVMTGALVTYAAVGWIPLWELTGGGDLEPVRSWSAWLLATVVAAVALRLLVAPGRPHLLTLPARIPLESLRARSDQLFWLTFLALCFWLSLGPRFGAYLAVAHLPGIRLIRVPSRFLLPGNLALAVLAGYGVARLARRWKGRTAAVGLVIVAGLFAIEANHAPMETWHFSPRPPAVYAWLGEQEGDFTVYEFPSGYDNQTLAHRQTFYSIYHWKDLIVGWSGWQSDDNLKLLRRIHVNFPGDEALDVLAELDVRYVLVREDFLDAEQLRRVRSAERLEPVRRFGAVQVYRLGARRSDVEPKPGTRADPRAPERPGAEERMPSSRHR